MATYNVDAYLVSASGNRKIKPEESREKIREILRAVKPDILALQEIGGASALLDLQSGLKEHGINLPYSDLVCGADTNIHLAVLSRFPIAQTRPQTNNSFLLSGRRFKLSRGFGEVDIQVSSNYSFTLITAHLKSKRSGGIADESEQRLEEAKLLRARVAARLAMNPAGNLVVLGDLNDTPESRSTRTILGVGTRALLDSWARMGAKTFRRSAMTIEEQPPESPDKGPAGWTYNYAKQDHFSRIDYILLSPGMAREWLETHIAASEGWELASDHRPVVATFIAKDL